MKATRDDMFGGRHEPPPSKLTIALFILTAFVAVLMLVLTL
jgi:hypothetical protein